MNRKQPDAGPKALVTVLETPEAAKEVLEALHANAFSLEKIELVVNHIADEAPEVETPRIHETTESELLDSAVKWGGVGAGTGLVAGLLTTFPGLALGMAIMGGVTGAIMGGMAGVDDAVNDDSVNLPKLDEYEQMVKDGHALVVVLGTHDEAMRAESVIRELPHIHLNIHPVHGHDFHEHPAR